MSYINLHTTEPIMYKAELTEQGMEVFLALLCTGSQACGFILLDVRHRFEEGKALLDACGVYVHGSHCGWVGARRVNARVTAAQRTTRSCAAQDAPHDALVCARRAARRAPRASQCPAPHAARITARRAARSPGIAGRRAGCTQLTV